jgi:hypothetical protein
VAKDNAVAYIMFEGLLTWCVNPYKVEGDRILHEILIFSCNTIYKEVAMKVPVAVIPILSLFIVISPHLLNDDKLISYSD